MQAVTKSKEQEKGVSFSSLSPSFFSSLTEEQYRQLIIILGEYKRKCNEYYSFKWEILQRSGFVYLMWEHKLYIEVVKPTLMTKNMFRVLIAVWSVMMSPRLKGQKLSKKEICNECSMLKGIGRVSPRINIPYLAKYNWLGWSRNHRFKHYWVTEKSLSLIDNYTKRYEELFDCFFSPLGL